MRAGRALANFEHAEREYLALYPVDLTARFLSLREPTIRVRVFETGDGPPLVLLPGAGTHALLWLPLLEHLPGHRFIVVDPPGRGRSDRFDYRKVDIRTHGPAFVGSLLDALGLQRATLVGHSLGGYRSLCFAHDSPDRVAALCLVGAPGLLSLYDTPPPSLLRLLATRGLGRCLVAAGRLSQEQGQWEQVAGTGAAAQPPEFFQYSWRESRLPGSAQAISAEFGTAVTVRGYRRDVLISERELAAISAPTLVVWGDTDAVGDATTGRLVAAAIPNSQFVEVVGGHLPWWDDAERCGRAIRDFVRTSVDS